jgi:hypothetical protein
MMKYRNMKVPRWVLGGLFGVSVLATIYCAYSYAGPYRWLAELSLSVFGSYSPKLTFFVSLVLLLLPPMVLAARFSPPSSAVEKAERKRAGEAQAAKLARVQSWLMLATVGAVFLFVGVRDLLAARAGATLVHTSCASIEAGTAPTSTWLEIEGTAIASAAVETKEGYASYLYVPFVSDNWSKGQPLPVVLRLGAAVRGDLNAHSYQGGLASEDLPGMVRTAYETEGVQAANALVLNVGRVPHDNLTTSQLAAAGGFLGLVLGGFMIWRKWQQ